MLRLNCDGKNENTPKVSLTYSWIVEVYGRKEAKKKEAGRGEVKVLGKKL